MKKYKLYTSSGLIENGKNVFFFDASGQILLKQGLDLEIVATFEVLLGGCV